MPLCHVSIIFTAIRLLFGRIFTTFLHSYLAGNRSPDLPNLMDDRYFTVARGVSAEISVKQSRFIAYLSPAAAEPDAESFLDTLRRRYHDATHHCYAYVAGLPEERIERFNDDGEPSGTAGRPILNVLLGKNIGNAVCVVVRYFGGTKLGVGGLSRAYGDAASAAVGKATVVTRYVTEPVTLTFPYDLTGAVEHLLTEFSVTGVERTFGEAAGLTCAVRRSDVQAFREKFRDITRDRGTIEI